MGTAVHLTLCGMDHPQAQEAAAGAEAAFARLDDIFSRFRPDSELARLNAHTGQWNAVSEPMMDVMSRMVLLAQQTDGLVDPSVGGHLAAAGYGLPEHYRLPSPAPDWHTIELDEAGMRIRCAPGQILEPAAIVKGMAIDEAGRALAGVPAWMINAGGDILTHGDWPGQGHWNVAIRSPENPDAIVATVRLHNESIATSGDYEVRHPDGWHHQINMRTGTPTDTWASVSVIAQTAERADTLASILFLFDRTHAPAYASVQKVAYLCIDHDGRQYANDAFQQRLVV